MQCWTLQTVPGGQETQATPPMPQAVSLKPGTQVEPAQQPFGQFIGLQPTATQSPA